MIQKLSILGWGKKKRTFSFQHPGSEGKLDTDKVSHGLFAGLLIFTMALLSHSLLNADGVA